MQHQLDPRRIFHGQVDVHGATFVVAQGVDGDGVQRFTNGVHEQARVATLGEARQRYETVTQAGWRTLQVGGGKSNSAGHLEFDASSAHDE